MSDNFKPLPSESMSEILTQLQQICHKNGGNEQKSGMQKS